MKNYLLTTLLLVLVTNISTSAIFQVNLTVQDHVDANPGDGVCEISSGGFCTLRAAIMEANANNTFDVIIIPSGTTVNLSLGSFGNSSTSSGDLDITEPLRIEGGDENTLPQDFPVINAESLDDRIFDLRFARGITLRRLRLTEGDSGSGVDVSTFAGGAIRVFNSTATGTSNAITIDQVHFDRNSADDGGALAVFGSTNEVNVINSVFDFNTSISNGAAVYVEDSNLNIDQSSLYGNVAQTGGFKETIYLVKDNNVDVEVNLTNVSVLGFDTEGKLPQTGINARGMDVRLRHVTVSEFDGRGIRMVGNGFLPRFTVHNSMIVDNGVDCGMDGDSTLSSISSNYTDENCNIPNFSLVDDSGLG
ncbi:Polymorphic membrane protein, Chlamydia, partial [hydrothermal vent metagenome]